MTVSKSDVNDAIVYGLSNTRTGAPIIDEDAFTIRYGENRGRDLLSRVGELLDDAMKIDVDWNSCTLVEGGRYVKGLMKERHPYLSDEALGLIGGYFNYRWR